MKWLVRIVQGLLAAIYLLNGVMKVSASSEQIQTLYTEALGYGVGFMRMIGVLEAIAGIGLIVGFRWPRFAALSSAIIVIIMTGAVVSLLALGQGAIIATFPFVMLVLALVVFFKTVMPLLSRYRQQRKMRTEG